MLAEKATASSSDPTSVLVSPLKNGPRARRSSTVGAAPANWPPTALAAPPRSPSRSGTRGTRERGHDSTGAAGSPWRRAQPAKRGSWTDVQTGGWSGADLRLDAGCVEDPQGELERQPVLGPPEVEARQLPQSTE